MRREYGLSQTAATMLTLLGIGAPAGVQIAGRLDARVLVAAVAFGVAAGIVLLPFLGAWPLAAAMPLLVVGAAALTCGNLPLDPGLAPLGGAGLILPYARRAYPGDVAAAALSEERAG